MANVEQSEVPVTISRSRRRVSIFIRGREVEIPSFLTNNSFLIYLIFGLVAGIGISVAIDRIDPNFKENERSLMYLAFPGQVMIRMLKVCIIPKIITSVVCGMAALPDHSAGRIGALTFLYFMTTTFLAVILGLIIVTLIQPGTKARDDHEHLPTPKQVYSADAILDVFRNILPENLAEAGIVQAQTNYTLAILPQNSTNNTQDVTVVIVDSEVTEVSHTNIIGLIAISIILGLTLGQMKDKGEPLRLVFEATEESLKWIIYCIIWFVPVGTIFIIAEQLLRTDDVTESLLSLAWYLITVITGLLIHGMVVIPTIYFLLTRKNPFRLLFNVSEALLTAFATASSSATLPLTQTCVQDKAGIDKRLSRFMLPVSTTLNMDGTALYEAVAAIYIAQVDNIYLDIGQIATISIAATIAAIGAAGFPQAGLVTMLIVLQAVGLPTDEIGLIIAVDSFLDRFRTMMNVWGDCVAVGCMEVVCKDALEERNAPDLRDLVLEEHVRHYSATIQAI